MSHEHEFAEPDSVVVDESLVIEQQCTHAEVLDSFTDDARDEVYYETGPRCDTIQRTVFGLAGVYPMVDGQRSDWAYWTPERRNSPGIHSEQAIMAAENRLVKQTDPYPDPVAFDPANAEVVVEVEVNGYVYAVVYEREKQETI